MLLKDRNETISFTLRTLEQLAHAIYINLQDEVTTIKVEGINCQELSALHRNLSMLWLEAQCRIKRQVQQNGL